MEFRVLDKGMGCMKSGAFPNSRVQLKLHRNVTCHFVLEKRRRPRFRPSISSSSGITSTEESCDRLEDKLMTFVREDIIPSGRLVISPLLEEDIPAASVVLTRAFATSPQGIPLDECRKYCTTMIKMPPRGIFLVARLFPTDAQTADDAGNNNNNDDDDDNNNNNTDDDEKKKNTWLRPGQNSRVIATAAISFDPISRETFLNLQPPDEDAYLCNIAVDPSFRRQGVARCMLAACEELTKQQKFSKIYLHVRLGDDAARQLYATNGFVEIAADSWLVKLRKQTPTALLMKDI